MSGSRPAALVVDLVLGGESGWELIRAVHADPRLRAVPVVVLSARPAVPPPGVARCAAYLTKPCRMARLREVRAQLVLDPVGREPASWAGTERAGHDGTVPRPQPRAGALATSGRPQPFHAVLDSLSDFATVSHHG